MTTSVFEPLEEASFNLVRSKWLPFVSLNTGRRVGEIAAIANFSSYQDHVVFTWFPGEIGEGFWEMKVPISQSHLYHRVFSFASFGFFWFYVSLNILNKLIILVIINFNYIILLLARGPD